MMNTGSRRRFRSGRASRTSGAERSTHHAKESHLELRLRLVQEEFVDLHAVLALLVRQLVHPLSARLGTLRGAARQLPFKVNRGILLASLEPFMETLHEP